MLLREMADSMSGAWESNIEPGTSCTKSKNVLTNNLCGMSEGHKSQLKRTPTWYGSSPHKKIMTISDYKILNRKKPETIGLLFFF